MEDEIKFDVAELDEIEIKNGKKFDYVRFSSPDIHGIPRASVVPRRHVLKALKQGFKLFSGRLSVNTLGDTLFNEELIELKSGNCEWVPCRKTIHNCPWVEQADPKKPEDDWLVGEVLCEVKWPLHYRGGCFVEASPRFVLRKQLHKLQELGFTLMSAFEIEFALFHSQSWKPVFDHKNASSLQIHAEFEKYLYTVERNCEKAGLDITALRVEHGEGQFELVMEPKYGVKMSDDLYVTKEAIKEISLSMGYLASFMTIPSPQLSGNAFHLNLSLWTRSSDGSLSNAFYDADDPDHLSKTFRHFIAGLIKHAKALTAFCCPTVNCYRRLHSFLTPHKVNWDINNRMVLFRVKTDVELSNYIENRLPSSSCNAYLATAATLVAGLDGIMRQLPLSQKCSDKSDPYCAMPKDDSEDNLPYCLEEALEELEKDDAMKEGMGEELVRWFVKIKKETEIEVTKSLEGKERFEKERELYFKYI